MSSESIQILMVVVIVALYIPACVVVARKAGYSGWLGLLTLVPVLNLVLIYWFALATWPIEHSRPLKSVKPDRLPIL